jgi:hypothetical protein
MEIDFTVIVAYGAISFAMGYTSHYLETRDLLKQYRKAITDASEEISKLVKQVKK